MELMSSLLLCLLLAYFPQILGDSFNNDYRDLDTFMTSNRTYAYPQNSEWKKGKLNHKGQPLVNFVADLEQIFVDMRCRNCMFCMEHAIKVYKAVHTENKKKRFIKSDAQKNIIVSYYDKVNRPKRNSESEVKTKKSKSKKSSKSVTVTKYNVGGDVYGLKVKESIPEGSVPRSNETSACHVYSIKKTYNCDSPESEIFLSVLKRKINKKGKKEKEKDKSTLLTTEKGHFMAPSFRKRHVDQAEIPENFEFSIEELY